VLPRGYFERLEQIYRERHQLCATFEIITVTGLAPIN
jgi:hypothetical protein